MPAYASLTWFWVIECQQSHKVEDDKSQQKCQKWLEMAESQGKRLKTPVDGLVHKSYGKLSKKPI